MHTLKQYVYMFAGLIACFIGSVQAAEAKDCQVFNKEKRNSRSMLQPNIIIIIAESHRAGALGVMGNTIVKTPNLDKLVSKGIAFTHAYVTTAICAVSRASILTGQYQQRHKINSFVTDFTEAALNQTYPLLLKKAGYTIGWIGKVGIGDNPPDSCFDYWQAVIPLQLNGVHNTDLVQEKVFEFLNRYRNDRFCLTINFYAAHEIDGTPASYMVQERYKDLYAGISITAPETADPKYWNSFPDFFRTDQNIARERWYGFFSTKELLQENTRNYYRLLTGVDATVGSVVKKLKRLGIADNTVIIYTSDHGFSLGEHGLMGKWYGFEESIRVPLIIYDPRSPEFKKGKIDQMALNIDIAPIVLGKAGIAVPAAMQGTDLIAAVMQNKPGREQFFYSHMVFSAPRLPKVAGVVTSNFKYMKYIEYGYEELYDTQRDPKETINLAKAASYRDKLNEMRELYERERSAIE
ncbi:MAG TPA: sulfatase-like hydrolase/transferase [Niabella sp.]|nr:sulfatase-like hydrolase/transferase [Niabella sp.]